MGRKAHTVVDVPDTAANRQWMKNFKGKWKAKVRAAALWMVSYRIEVD